MRFLLLLCLLSLSPAAWPAPHVLPQSAKALDEQLAAILQSLSAGNLTEARILARQTATSFPRSDLAHLLAAELGASAAHRLVLAGKAKPFSQRLQDLLQEARARLHDRPGPADPMASTSLPNEVIQLGRNVSALLVADLADSSLHHLTVNEGMATLIGQHYIGSGKAGFDKRLEGDNRTPLGIYNIDGYRSDASLPDLYGAGALTLDYPNALDRYLGRTGSGIWLHGVPHSQRSRSPRSSEGCVTMSNDHFTILQRRLTSEPWTLPHSPSPPLRQGKPIVLLTHEVHWRDAESRERDQKTFQRLFEQYQRAWHQRNVMQLFGLYASPSLARDRLHQVINQEPQGSLLLDSVNKHDISIFYSPTLTKTYQSRPVVRPTVPSYGVMGRTVNSFTKSNTDTAQDTATGPFVVMQMQIGEFAEHRLTLYWGQTAWGEWQLLTEVWSTVNS